uniref:Uncharacterized protein n=1 Tax=Branchiostoma floridae TaxID=7739 RepID=C3ZXS9_BRAFL|eukprot:XP_002586619.1 hypothetical protein BRAFLDRAFT_131302 [Branchiostoma floridae]
MFSDMEPGDVVLLAIFVVVLVIVYTISKKSQRGTDREHTREAWAARDAAAGGSGDTPPSYGSLYPDLSQSGSPSPARHRFTRIDNRFHTLQDVSRAIREAGLESSNLIFAKTSGYATTRVHTIKIISARKHLIGKRFSSSNSAQMDLSNDIKFACPQLEP